MGSRSQLRAHRAGVPHRATEPAEEYRPHTAAYGPAARDSALRQGRLDWTGLTDGYAAFAHYDSATNTTAVIAANVVTGAVVRLHDALPRLATGAEATPPRAPTVRAVPLSAARRRRPSGSYEARPGEAAALTFLTPLRAVFGGSHLVATSDTSFAPPEAYGATIFVERDRTGAVTTLRWRAPSDSARCPRLGAPRAP